MNNLTLIPKRCESCGIEFQRNSNRQIYCPDCGPNIRHEQKLEHNRRYAREKRYGKQQAEWRKNSEKRKQWMIKYKKSEAYTEANKKKSQKYYGSEKGKNGIKARHATKAYKAAQKESRCRSYHALKGQISYYARRRDSLQEPNVFADWKAKLIVNGGQPCNSCGVAYGPTHEIDHIIPLAFGWLLGLTGLDNPDNYQVLCRNCHWSKTSSDMRLINKFKKVLKEEKNVLQIA